MEADKILCDRLLNNVATLFMWGALSEEETGGLIVDGTAKILEGPEYADAVDESLDGEAKAGHRANEIVYDRISESEQHEEADKIDRR